MHAFARLLSGMCQGSIRDYFEEVQRSVGHMSMMNQAGINDVTGLCQGSAELFLADVKTVFGR